MFRWVSILIFYILFCGVQSSLRAQDSTETITVYFLYGSRPSAGAAGSIEKHLFGGIHGGHVSIGIDNTVIGFHHLQGMHLFPHRKNYDGAYECIPLAAFLKDTISKQYATIEVPLSLGQYQALKVVIKSYLNQTPYDYAFFGMRCTAATYEILSSIHLLKHKSRFGIIISNFYPRKLRKRMFKIAADKNYPICFKAGRVSRVWEKD